MPELKNETFIKNITDPRTGKQVKKIYQIKVSKLNRLVEPLVWEYYKNRANTSVESIYKKFNGYQLKFIFFADPVIYTIDTVEANEPVDNLPNNSTLKKLRAKDLNQETFETVETVVSSSGTVETL
jgi:hypothetical protein